MRATAAAGKASAAVTGALGAQGAAAAMVQKATAGATAVTQALTSATARATEAADSATTNVVRLAGGVEQSGSAADTAAGKFSSLERMQHRGRAATRMLRGELGRLNDTLGSLAMGSIVTQGAERAGRSIIDPLRRSVDQAAEFQRGMTGIGIMANQQAAMAAIALVINQNDTKAGLGYNSFRDKISGDDAVKGYFDGIQKASSDQMASLVRLQNAEASIAISTGTVLAPAMEKLASAMGAAAKVVTDMEAKHTLLSKAIVYGAGGVGVAALGLGALGNAAMGIAAPILIARSLFGRIVPLATASAAGKLAEKVGAIGEESPAAIAGVARLAGAVEGLAAIPFLPIAAGIAAVGAAIGVEAWLASKAKIAPAAQARAVSTAYGHSLSAPHKAAASVVAAAGRLSSAAYGHSLSTSSMRAANDLGVWSARAAAITAQHSRSVSHLGAAAIVAATSLSSFSAAAAAVRPPSEVAAHLAAHPSAAGPQGAQAKPHEVHHHHHGDTVIHVQGSTDPHRLAQELGRLQARATRRALLDEADG